MPTSPVNFIARGMNHVQAGELATQIDGTPSAVKLMGLGFPAPLANELSAQMTAGTGNATRLRGLGMPSDLAVKVAADITTAGP